MTVTLELPSDLAAKLEGRAKDGGFSDARDYIRALIDADSADRSAPASVRFEDVETLKSLVEAGIASGDSGEITPEEWEAKRESLRRRFGHGVK